MKKINKYIGFLAIGAGLLTATSCSDTWDEHYAGGEGSSATQTLWEQISSNPNLSKFASIAEKVTYYKDEKNPQKGYTFKDMLSGTQLLTVWAPENDAISDEEYAKWLEMAETNQFSVQQQLLGNSISMWRNVATGSVDTTLTMLNGKKMNFNKGVPSMQGIDLREKNIAAVNGILHTVGSKLPFKYNFYEYVKDEANTEVSTFRKYIVQSDSTYFSRDNSIEGNPDANGNPTYVDSVKITTNTMFFGNKRFPSNSNTDQYLTYDESFGANLIGEDSAFVMVIPTDEAWSKAYSKLEKLYNYAPKYVDNEKANQGTTNVYREFINPDSLKEKSINMDILSPLCYNLHIQPNAAGQKNRWQMKDFVNEKGASAEYFINTYGDTLRTDDTWDKTSIFNGEQKQMSNGMAFIANDWAFPRKLYKPNLNVEIGYRSLYNTSKATGSVASYSFSNAREWSDTTGHVSFDNFYYIYPQSATGNPKFEFSLVGTDGENVESEVMSGKYDIYLVMVPNYYITSNDTAIVYTADATLTSGPNDMTGHVVKEKVKNDEGKDVEVIVDTIPVKHKIVATLSYNNGAATGKDATITSAVIDYDGQKVDSLLLFENFEFPYSYKNMRQCYPTISITTKTTSSERKAGYSNYICVDRIVLVSKEDE